MQGIVFRAVFSRWILGGFLASAGFASGWVTQPLSDVISDDAITVIEVEARSGFEFSLLGFRSDRTEQNSLVCSISGKDWKEVIDLPFGISWVSDGELYRHPDGTLEVFFVVRDLSMTRRAFSSVYTGTSFSAPEAVIAGDVDGEIKVAAVPSGGVLIDLGDRLVHRKPGGEKVVLPISEIEEDEEIVEGMTTRVRDYSLSSRDLVVDQYGFAHLARNYSMTETVGETGGPTLTSAFGSGLAYARVPISLPVPIGPVSWNIIVYEEGGFLPERIPARDPRVTLIGDIFYMVTEHWEWEIADPRDLKTELWIRNINPSVRPAPFSPEQMTTNLQDDYLVYLDESGRQMTAYTGTANAQTELPLSVLSGIEALPGGEGTLLTATPDGHLVGYIPNPSPINDEIFMADEIGDLSDFDNDGFSHLFECVMESDPFNDRSFPQIETSIDRTGRVTFSFLTRAPVLKESESVFRQTDKNFFIEFQSSPDLVTWVRDDLAWESDSFTITGRGTVVTAIGTVESTMTEPYRRIRVGRMKSLAP